MMTIRAKLALGFGICVLITAFASGTGWWAATRASQRTDALVNADLHRLRLSNAATESLAAARLAERRFLESDDLEAQQDARDHLATAEGDLVRLKELVPDEEAREAVAASAALVRRFEETLVGVVTLRKERGLTPEDGLRGKLAAAAKEVEELVTAQGLAELSLLVGRCRRVEKDYLLQGGGEIIAAVGAIVKEFDEQMVMYGVAGDDQESIRQRLNGYQTGFVSIVRIDERIAEAIAEMERTASELEERMSGFRRSTHEGIDASTTSLLGQLSLSRVVLIGILGVALVLGCTVGFLITRSVFRILGSTIRNLAACARRIGDAARQVAGRSEEVAADASRQAASIEETAAALQEVSATAGSNAGSARQADSQMGDARRVIESAGDVSRSLNETMEQVASATEESSKIIKTIDEIAFQTNLLALNAAVEAARAGSAGAGFAVVADEVRNLAMRAGEAARDTARIIEGVTERTGDGRELSRRSNEAFDEVRSHVDEVGRCLGDIAVASEEQTQGIDQVNQAVGDMEGVTQRNAASAESSTVSAREMEAEAERLSGIVKELASVVGGRLGDESHPPETPTSMRSERPPMTPVESDVDLLAVS
jgi:hypothetical protein